jgi:hypothetical protein
VRVLLDAVFRRTIVLDLSEVHEAEADAVRLLAELPPDRCQLTDCPLWLTLWIERECRPLRSKLVALGAGT